MSVLLGAIYWDILSLTYPPASCPDFWKVFGWQGVYLSWILADILRCLYSCLPRSQRPQLQPQPHQWEEKVGTGRLCHSFHHRILPNTLAPGDGRPPGRGAPLRTQLHPQPPDSLRCCGQCLAAPLPWTLNLHVVDDHKQDQHPT